MVSNNKREQIHLKTFTLRFNALVLQTDQNCCMCPPVHEKLAAGALAARRGILEDLLLLPIVLREVLATRNSYQKRVVWCALGLGVGACAGAWEL